MTATLPLVLSYRPVAPDDADFLYQLLLERPPEANISHRGMPSMEEHLAFMESHPYAIWEIILVDGWRVGAVYLVDSSIAGQKVSSIGIAVAEAYHHRGIGRQAVRDLMQRYPRTRFHANVAPGNAASQRFFQSLGFRVIQYTYAMEP